MSPTQLSLKLLRARGYRAEVVERWNGHAKIRQDLFGVVDILAVKAGEPIKAVQTTTATNLRARVEKAAGFPALWRACGGAFEFHGWAKQGPRGKRKVWGVKILYGGEACDSTTSP